MILKHMKLPILSGPQEGLPRPRQIKKKKKKQSYALKMGP